MLGRALIECDSLCFLLPMLRRCDVVVAGTSPFSLSAAAIAACAVLDADAFTLLRRWTRCVGFVADSDNEFECDRCEEDMREKLPDTGFDTLGS